MTIGKLEVFNVESDSWSTYVERLEQYFIVNETKEEHKVPTLITVMGNQAYELLVTLCTPDKPASKKFADLVKVMSGHLQPKPSLLAERYRFRNRKQRTGESVADFVAELKKLAKHCVFGNGLTESLRDQLVCGLGDETIRQRLFTVDDISFDRALQMAVAMEAAQANAAAVVADGRAKGLEGSPSTSSGCHAVSAQSWRGKRAMTSYRATNNNEKRPPGNSASQLLGPRRPGQAPRDWRRTEQTALRTSSGAECSVCGRPHDSSSCKFANYVCRVCNQSGHLKKMCPRLQIGVSTHKNDVRDEADSDYSDEVQFNVFNVNDIFQCKPFMLPIKLEGNLVEMEVDTGSAISCINGDLYLKLFSHLPLHRSNIVMCYYTNEKKQPLGKIVVNVMFKKVCKPLELYVVDQGKEPLLGRMWLRELGFKLDELACHDVEVTARFDLNELNSRYREVFEEGLGRYTGGEVSLRVREGARPVFLRARPLAYALREPVERALDQLERDGVITPVDSSDWATPIVPVVKTDGTIRVCGDFKSTLNKCLEVDRFPLPRVEDLLTKLNGGEKFTKIDLSQAYAQFVLDEHSRAYTVINTHRGLYRYNRLIYGLSSSPGIFQ
ncbi:uncharacterized protein K02A2.6-like [Cydia strobilella]|uniref:uncharacterized protein K02A2.6-like n=1 Tax=Cydia strobilella TaxID=1100964 RepID=UPI003005DE20